MRGRRPELSNVKCVSRRLADLRACWWGRGWCYSTMCEEEDVVLEEEVLQPFELEDTSVKMRTRMMLYSYVLEEKTFSAISAWRHICEDEEEDDVILLCVRKRMLFLKRKSFSAIWAWRHISEDDEEDDVILLCVKRMMFSKNYMSAKSVDPPCAAWDCV